jgi:hypothetical protein
VRVYKNKGVAKHIYGVYRIVDDEFIMQGTADEVAKYLGRTRDAVFQAVSNWRKGRHVSEHPRYTTMRIERQYKICSDGHEEWFDDEDTENED